MSNRLHHFLQELHGHTHKLRQAIGNDADLKQAAQEAFVFLNAIGEDHLETMVAKDLAEAKAVVAKAEGWLEAVNAALSAAEETLPKAKKTVARDPDGNALKTTAKKSVVTKH